MVHFGFFRNESTNLFAVAEAQCPVQLGQSVEAVCGLRSLVLATSIATRCKYASNVLIGAIRFVAILSHSLTALFLCVQ